MMQQNQNGNQDENVKQKRDKIRIDGKVDAEKERDLVFLRAHRFIITYRNAPEPWPTFACGRLSYLFLPWCRRVLDMERAREVHAGRVPQIVRHRTLFSGPRLVKLQVEWKCPAEAEGVRIGSYPSNASIEPGGCSCG